MPNIAATPKATAAYALRFPEYAGFYRTAQGLTVSTLGLGTYLGPMDDLTDENYENAVRAAVGSGINFLDTSLNYRHQRSERAVGRALAAFQREDVVICTKAGYLVPGALPVGALKAADVAGNMHCMAPAFLVDQLQRSLVNLAVSAIDVFYLHNPETQLQFVDVETFYGRMRQAFETLEAAVGEGSIRYYGTATWNGYRANGGAGSLSVVRLEAIARDIAGEGHHFRFLQLPFNLAMTEAYGQRAETISGRKLSVLDAAEELGLTTVASASLLQARLSSGLPETLIEAMPGPVTDAARAIQFTRSAPGITTALVGMSRPAHVAENLGVAGYPPMARADFERLFG